VDEETAVGVPEIAPVEVSNERPEGRVGVIDHDKTAPPVDDGVAVVIEVPLVRVSEFGEKTIEGVASLTTIVSVAVSEPPVLVAVMV
tara:strand:- start:888 stop:1148 length:261 start_codon:yes stop_codon:yes gene_type:complete